MDLKDEENRKRNKLHCKKFRYLRRSPDVVITVKSRGYDVLHGTRMGTSEKQLFDIQRRKEINGRILLKRLL